MARSHGAATNGGRPAPRRPGDIDPRTGRTQPPGQRYGQPAPQPAPNPGYPQAPYPEQHAPPGPAYDPQTAYHYPQQPPQQPAAPRFPQGPGAPDLVTQPPGPADYQSYPVTQPPYGRPQPQAAPQPRTYSAPPGPAPAKPAGYRPPTAPSFAPQADPRTAPPSYDQWPAPAPQAAVHPAPHQDPHGYDLGSFLPTGTRHPDPGLHPAQTAYPTLQPDPLQQQAEWVHAASVPYGDPLADQPYHPAAQLGLEPASHNVGSLEPAHAQDEGDYEFEEPRRGSWALRIAGAIVVAVGLGYGIAQGYKLILGSSPDGTTPVIKNDSMAARSTPVDPGGKQFSHTDSKVMGRLGEGTPASEASTSSSSSDADASGTRRVPTVVVSRDGQIVPPTAPAAPAEAAPAAETVAVPGLTVIDGFGGRYPGAVTTSAMPAQPAAPASEPIVVNPPAKPTKSAKAKVAPPPPPPVSDPAADEGAAAEKAVAPKKTTMAAAEPVDAGASGANGYVVVLASVPASGSSRLDALKRFADMQQKYGAVLQNKTPDVRETNLGDKGTFHRLLVGPPGSRAQASALCSELKAAGYKDCWVTAY